MPWYELKSSKHPYFSPCVMEGFEEIKEPKPSGESNAQEATHEEFMAAVSEGEKKESKKK